MAMLALERLFSGMYSLMLLEVMFELESLSTVGTFELPEVWSVRMIRHVSLEFVEAGELFGTQGARLEWKI